jgi:hypothetical protein
MVNEIQGVRINVLPGNSVCCVVREAIYNRLQIEGKNLEEEKIALIMDKIEMDMNRAFALGYNIGVNEERGQ